ncbi:hypothetical protein SVIOM74S_00617 [Streptomyces violarus]
MLALGVHRVAGHHRAREAGDGVEQGLEAADLIRLLSDIQLGEDAARGVVEGGEQVDLPAVRAGDAAQALPVDRDRAPSLGREGLRPPVGEPASHRAVERITVDPGQDPADDRFVRRRMASGQRITPGSERAEDIGRNVGGTLADRQQRGRSGQYGGGSQGKHVRQSVAHPARIRRVGYLGESFQQARVLAWPGRRLIAALVKGGWDRRWCSGRHGLSAGSRGVENSVIVEAVPASHLDGLHRRAGQTGQIQTLPRPCVRTEHEAGAVRVGGIPRDGRVHPEPLRLPGPDRNFPQAGLSAAPRKAPTRVCALNRSVRISPIPAAQKRVQWPGQSPSP